jgi:CheY-like chemotaxis protein
VKKTYRGRVHALRGRRGTSPFCPSVYPDCGKRAKTAGDGGFAIESLDPQLIFRVLVVEDDCQVRAMAAAMLRDLGCIVTEAADGSAALTLLQADPGISLLFTDLLMPRMSGRELAAEARKLRPDLNVLYTSAHSDDSLSHSQEWADGSFLSKPYRQDDLAEAVRFALTAPSPDIALEARSSGTPS